MKYIKDRPIWIWIFAVVIILFNLYYYYPVYTGTWEHIDSIFTISGWALFVWFNLILAIVELYAVTIGFYRRRPWARIYEIGLLSYSSFWAIMSMYVMRWQIYEHYGYFVMYLILISWLLMSPAKEYFGLPEEET